MSTNVWFLGMDMELLERHRTMHGVNADDILEDEVGGVTWLGDTFEGAWLFFEDVQDRLGLGSSQWVEALGEGVGRVPPGTPEEETDETLLGMARAGWVLLARDEIGELSAAVRRALVRDPEWAADESANGPTWKALLGSIEQESPVLVAVGAL